MTNVQKKLDNAFRLLSAIPVHGDNVDIMARVRDLLREAYREMEVKPDADSTEDNH